MVISKKVHLHCNDSVSPSVYFAYEKVESCPDSWCHIDKRGRLAPIDYLHVSTDIQRLYTTDNVTQMYSYLYQSGYSCNDVIVD